MAGHDDKSAAEFANSVSMIGARIIFDSGSHVARRAVWLLLVCAGLVLLGYQLHDRFTTYANHPITAQYGMRSPEDIALPAVTVCNLNTIKKSYADAHNLNGILTSFGTVASEAYRGKKYNGQRVTVDKEKNQLRELDYKAIVTKGGMALNELIITNLSYFDGMEVSGSDFRASVTPTGLCYMFNADLPARTVKAAGRYNGLQLVLNTHLEEYSPFSVESSAGFKVFLHKQFTMPNIFNEGIRISPGTEYDIAISQVVYNFLEAPLGDCDQSAQLRYFAKTKVKYSSASCLSECASDVVNASCACHISGTPHSPDVDECSNTGDFSCALVASYEFYKNHKVQHGCGCPQECQITDYAVTTFGSPLTTAFLERIAPHVNDANNKTASSNSGRNSTTSSRSSQDTNVATLRQNIAKVWLYFDKLRYEEISQVEAYTFWSLLSDMGGALGLLLGSAVLTACEVLDFVLLYVYRRNQKKSAVLPTMHKQNKTNIMMCPPGRPSQPTSSAIFPSVLLPRRSRVYST